MAPLTGRREAVYISWSRRLGGFTVAVSSFFCTNLASCERPSLVGWEQGLDKEPLDSNAPRG